MYMMRKKDVLKELAVSLFLILEFDRDTTAISITKRIQEKAKNALQAAVLYTGVIGQTEANEFLEVKIPKFTIDCGRNIVKGDTLRFVEMVYDNRRIPQRLIGKRGIIAEVLSQNVEYGNPMVTLRVISCGGTWNLKPGIEIARTIKIITRMEVMRAPWNDESQRGKIDNVEDRAPCQIKSAKVQLMLRRGIPKDK